jgi:hypothetical protein
MYSCINNCTGSRYVEQRCEVLPLRRGASLEETVSTYREQLNEHLWTPDNGPTSRTNANPRMFQNIAMGTGLEIIYLALDV